jgi:hypothetical protein
MSVFSNMGATKKGKALTSLASLKTQVLDGAAADTDIAVTGAQVGDVIQSAIMYAAGVPSDVTDQASFTSAGNLQVTVSTASNKIVLAWFPESA